MLFFDPLYFIIVSPALILAVFAQVWVKKAYSKYSRVATASGYSGAQAAAEILRRNGVMDVDVEVAQGFLSDHYDPGKKVLRLSPDVYSGRTMASVGIAAHEAGHALQHADGYAPLKLRTALVPMTMLGSNLAFPLLFIGFLMQSASLVNFGIIFFGTVVLFQVVTLPVEFNASRRALAMLRSTGVVSTDELSGARSVLTAAAMTYVAAALSAILQLVYFLLRAGLLGGRDD
ncbi:MAG: zinc metallopeptidase [Deltaproteobacteria bacterium]|nr:zinc metallopeptidase [Deltaproteobacteria bacterium]